MRVAPAPRGKKPSWGGFIPQLLSFDLCQQVKAILQSNDPVPYIDGISQAALDEGRQDLQPLLAKTGLQFEADRVLWWTFAGGQINHTLKYGLQFHHDWKVVADNFKIKIEGDSVGPGTVNLSIREISQPGFWSKPAVERFIFSQLPDYRLSKFQKALPEAFALEIIYNYLLDPRGTNKFIQEIALSRSQQAV